MQSNPIVACYSLAERVESFWKCDCYWKCELWTHTHTCIEKQTMCWWPWYSWLCACAHFVSNFHRFSDECTNLHLSKWNISMGKVFHLSPHFRVCRFLISFGISCLVYSIARLSSAQLSSTRLDSNWPEDEKQFIRCSAINWNTGTIDNNPKTVYV